MTHCCAYATPARIFPVEPKLRLPKPDSRCYAGAIRLSQRGTNQEHARRSVWGMWIPPRDKQTPPRDNQHGHPPRWKRGDGGNRGHPHDGNWDQPPRDKSRVINYLSPSIGVTSIVFRSLSTNLCSAAIACIRYSVSAPEIASSEIGDCRSSLMIFSTRLVDSGVP